MAATAAVVTTYAVSPVVEGAYRRVWVKITLDSSYPNTSTFATSGYPITAAILGVSQLVWVDAGSKSDGGATFWDAPTGLLHCFVPTTGLEVGNGVTQAGLFCFAECVVR